MASVEPAPRRLRDALTARHDLRLSSTTVLVAVAIVLVCDALIWQIGGLLAARGVFDETAHVATTVVALAAIAVALPRPAAAAALAASVLIDLDHVPALLGSHIIDNGAPRPYSHSLVTLLVVGAVAARASGRARQIWLGIAFGLAFHLLRDLAEPGGPGVALLWPASSAAATIPYFAYALVMLALATAAVARRTRSLRGRSRRMRRLPGGACAAGSSAHAPTRTASRRDFPRA